MTTRYAYLVWDDADLSEADGAHLWAMVTLLHAQHMQSERVRQGAPQLGATAPELYTASFQASQAVLEIMRRTYPTLNWRLDVVA
jgi:hypothetical protein